MYRMGSPEPGDVCANEDLFPGVQETAPEGTILVPAGEATICLYEVNGQPWPNPDDACQNEVSFPGVQTEIPEGMEIQHVNHIDTGVPYVACVTADEAIVPSGPEDLPDTGVEFWGALVLGVAAVATGIALKVRGHRGRA